MNMLPLIHLTYFTLAAMMTIWVARTLHQHGALFLVDAFEGNEELAKAVNHLLVVGFYLINLGFILLFVKYGQQPANTTEGIEYAATKLGVVMLALGIIHFINVNYFNNIRKTHRIPSTLPNK